MGRVSVAAHINTRIRKKYMQLSLGPNVYVGRVVHSEEGHQRALTDAAWQKPPAPAGLLLHSAGTARAQRMHSAQLSVGVPVTALNSPHHRRSYVHGAAAAAGVSLNGKKKSCSRTR